MDCSGPSWLWAYSKTGAALARLWNGAAFDRRMLIATYFATIRYYKTTLRGSSLAKPFWIIAPPRTNET